MSRGRLLGLTTLTSLALLGQGCATNTCERLCEWLGEISDEREEERWGECEEVCRDDYGDAGNYCRNSLYDLSKCVAGVNGTEERPLDESTWSDCDAELAMAVDDCACNENECDEECAQETGYLRLRSPTCQAIIDTRP